MPSPRVDTGQQLAAIGRQQLSVNTRSVFPMGGEHILKILCKKRNFLENLAFKLPRIQSPLKESLTYIFAVDIIVYIYICTYQLS